MHRKNKLILVAGRFITDIGDEFFSFGNNTWIASLGKSGRNIMAFYQISESIAGIILNLFAGAIADSFRKKAIIITTDAISGIICFFMAVVYPTRYFVYFMLFFNVCLTILSLFGSPAYKSIIPSLVEQNGIVRINSWLETVNQVVSISSPLIALMVINAIGLSGVLVIDGISFEFSAFLNGQLALNSNIHPKTNEKNIFDQIGEGLTYIEHEPALLLLLGVSSGVNFFLAGYNFAFPYVNAAFHTGSHTYAILLIAQSIGGLAGASLCQILPKKNTSMSLFSLLGMCGISIISTFIVSYVLKILALIFIFIMLFHMFLTVYNILFFSNIQGQVSTKYLGRVFSVIFTVAVLFMPIGTFVFSRLFKQGSTISYLFVGVGILAISILGMFVRKVLELEW